MTGKGRPLTRPLLSPARLQPQSRTSPRAEAPVLKPGAMRGLHRDRDVVLMVSHVSGPVLDLEPAFIPLNLPNCPALQVSRSSFYYQEVEARGGLGGRVGDVSAFGIVILGSWGPAPAAPPPTCSLCFFSN